MKKRILATLMALVILASLCACGKKEETPAPAPAKPAASEPAPAPAPTPAPAPAPAPEPEPEPEPEIEPNMETPLWSLYYDEAVWTNDEGSFKDSDDYSKAKLLIKNDEDKIVVTFTISASVEDPTDFRNGLKENNVDAEDYVENGGGERVTLGGVEFVKGSHEYWGDVYLHYLARIEGAKTTFDIGVNGDLENPAIEELLGTLKITAEDVGNEDYPWPWQGERFSTDETHTFDLAGKTLTSTYLPFEEPFIVDDIFSHVVATSNDYVYILSEELEALNKYSIDGSSLKLEKTIDLGNDYDCLYADASGALWVSGFADPLLKIVDDEIAVTYDKADKVVMSPDATWAFEWFSGNEWSKLTMGDGSFTRGDKQAFSDIGSIRDVFIDDQHLYVTGSDVNDNDDQKVFIFDHNVNLQMVLGPDPNSNFGLGSITSTISVPSGFFGMDGNYRNSDLWGPDGTWLGLVEDSDLFGTNYPWYCSTCKLSDGSLLTIMTERRPDQSATELIAFKLTGL